MERRSMGASPERAYQSARYAIILLVALTAVNIFMRAVSIDRYFVSSVFLSYFAVNYFGELGNLALGVAIAAAIIVPYVLAFILSKQKPVWMIIALALFAVDTLFVIFMMVRLKRVGVSPFGMILDLLMHGFVIFELAMGVKYRKAATAGADGAEEGPAMPSDEDGTYSEVSCVIAVSKENGKHTLEETGVVRFYENEIVIGTVGTAKALLIGAAYSASTERMRFGYAEISRAYFAKENERTVRLDLADGRYTYFILTDANRDQLLSLLGEHGVTVEPFAG